MRRRSKAIDGLESGKAEGVFPSARVFALLIALGPTAAWAQNRGVYPLGMTSVSSGVMPAEGFNYGFQFLDYSRDRSKDAAGNTLPVMGSHAVLMFLNTFTWASPTFCDGFQASASATIPIASNNLTTEAMGNVSGGTGLADSYFVPATIGWARERIALRLMYGFLAPTGRFSAEATDNVGSGYWTHTLSAGQTFYPMKNKRLIFSAFEMYEFHTTQTGTETHPGQTFDLDYSIMGVPVDAEKARLQLGLVGYEQWQTTGTFGPAVSLEAFGTRYRVNAIGAAASLTLPKQKVTLSFRYFDEFANRSTFEGYSLQIAGAVAF
jgi:hypothetical protein